MSKSAGSSLGGKAKISLTGLNDEVTIHQVGKTNGTHNRHSRPYRSVFISCLWA